MGPLWHSYDDDVASNINFQFLTDPTIAIGNPASAQGRTLVHFSAQFERFLSDRGCAQGLCSPC